MRKAKQLHNEVGQILNLRLCDLTIHPMVKKLYPQTDIDVLAFFIKECGQLQPIVVNERHQILSGQRRFLAIKSLYDGNQVQSDLVKSIIIKETKDVSDLVIGSNQYRRPGYDILIREAEIVLNVIGKRQGKRNDLLQLDSFEKGLPSNIGKDRYDIAAKIMGNHMSGQSLRRLMHIVDFERESVEHLKLGLVKKIVEGEIKVNSAFEICKRYRERLVEKKDAKIIALGLPKPNKNALVHHKSCECMDEVGDDSVQLVFTSIPYWKLRNYGNSNHDVELGLELSPQKYIDNVVNQLKEVKRVLKPNGSFFLNIGPTYSKDHNYLIPERLSIRVCDQLSFHRVNKIIWVKKNPIPLKSDKKLQTSYEEILHFTKSNDYDYWPLKFWTESTHNIKLSACIHRELTGEVRKAYGLSRHYKMLTDYIEEQKFHDLIVGNNAAVDKMRLNNLDDKIDHPAIFPDYLPVLAILTTTQPGDLILDPFCGTGTTGDTAIKMGRNFIGYDINQSYADFANKRLSLSQTELSAETINVIECALKQAA